MKYEKEKLNIEEGIKREWVITNGLGGYASSTILGVNTRKYHGLLVAPLNPPGSRNLILSKLDESIEIDGKSYGLFTNMCKNYVSDGYKYLERFEKEYIPIFTYKVEDVEIKKFICMEHGKNTVAVLYTIKNGDHTGKFTVAPIINFRDFHSTTKDYDFNLKQDITENKVKIIVNEHSTIPIYMNMTEGKYIKHEHDIFRNMYYIEEEKRGLGSEENLVVPGRYEIELKPNEEKCITFVCSLENNIEEIDARNLINKEIIRITSLIYDSYLLDEKNKNSQNPDYKEMIKNYIIASDNFVVYRPSFALYTLIAGYPWFLDWGRDTLISFEGILLIPRRFKIAKEVLLTCIRDIKYGLVPNGYSGYDGRPLYNSVDSSLLLFEQVKKYLNYTQDYEFFKNNLYEVLIKIIDSYASGINLDNNNIYLDEDGLISSGTPDTQNTWMDAKIGSVAITPRNGKAIEINALWYNALKIMEEFTKLYNDKELSKKYASMARKCKTSFNEKFYNKKRKSLYDVLGDGKIRPNQLAALSLSYQVIEPGSEIAKEIFNTVTKKLLTPYGLKTLAKGEPCYRDVYEGDNVKRDMSYHQGITWPWLLGMYSDSYKNIIKAEKNKKEKQRMEEEYNKFVEGVENTFIKEMYENSTVGSISELYDSTKPYLAKGSIAQAWSVAEVFRIILKHKNMK